MAVRVKSYPALTPSYVVDRYFDKNQKKWFTSVDSLQQFSMGTDLQSGTTNPGYLDRIIRGIDATSAYTRKKFECKPGFTRMQTIGLNYDGYRFQSYYPSPMPQLSYTAADVVNEASNRLKRKLRDFVGSSNQLTNLAELRELPRTIQGVAGSAYGLLKAVSNSKRRGSELRKWASNQWLTWSFGVLPTLNAIDDAISSVNSYLKRDDHFLREFGVHSKDWTSSFRTTGSGPMGALIIRNGNYVHNLSCKITAGYRMNIKSANNYSLGKHLGFDISSVVPTAWELLPFSWLIDYFTTAGSFIEDQFSANPGNSVYLSQTVKLRITGQETYEPLVSSGWLLDLFNTAPTQFSYIEMVRTPLTSLPHAPLRFKTSNEVASHAINKLLNLASILGSKK